MSTITNKLMKKFGIDAENAAALVAAGYAYPVVIRAAERADLEEIVDSQTLVILKGEE